MILVVGHSHIECLRAAARAAARTDFVFLNLGAGFKEPYASCREEELLTWRGRRALRSRKSEVRQFRRAGNLRRLLDALLFIRGKNPKVRIILTVSPVPLNATFEDRHVLVSTTWSKAVLRVVAERASRTIPECVYFPSYEIITSPYTRGVYFGPDCREVTEAGVDHVMALFFRKFATDPVVSDRHTTFPEADMTLLRMTEAIQILCDEAALDADKGTISPPNRDRQVPASPGRTR